MELKKLAPWNWFKKEEEHAHPVRVQRAEKTQGFASGHSAPMLQLHRDIDTLFDQFFAGWGMPELNPWGGIGADTLLKPKVDLSAADTQYQLSVEIPGVNEKDITIDIRQNTMTIRGEKRQTKEEKEKNYYRIERSYGAFQRILSLPEDVDQDTIEATFKNGVLTVTMPRKAIAEGEAKQVAITSH
nr:Hsp20/alpha crystallin family protein [uncultured Desulfobulbus sp.]